MKSERNLYVAGAVAAILVAAGSLADIVIGMALGADLNALPATAFERFAQIKSNPIIGLYNLDALNLLTTFIMIPCMLALGFAHRQASPLGTYIALVLTFIGTAVFISGNPALPMLELSRKFSTATPEQQPLLAAAAEAILARGAHGSAGVYCAFVLPTAANILLSFVMLKGKLFGRYSPWFGIIGHICLLTYLTLVTFVPQTRTIAMAIAAPGGILAILWLVLSAKGLLNLAGTQ